MPDKSIAKVSHYGTIHIDTLAFDCVVLNNEEHTRAYIQRQIAQAVGFQGQTRSIRFQRFLAETAPNALSLIDKSEYPVAILPQGGTANIYPAGILTEIAAGVMESAANGNLHSQRKGLIASCAAIYRALAKTGEIALIDEATGYQTQRASTELTDFFSRILREEMADWERRFHPDYYESLFELFGWRYTGQREKPLVIGNITARWVYESVFPDEIIAELRRRRTSIGTKLHQWLKDGGLSLLEKQINAVTMIARSSIDYPDFSHRCETAFLNRQQQRMLLNGGAV